VPAVLRAAAAAAALLAGSVAPAAGQDPAAPDPARPGPAYDVYVTEDQEVVEQIGPRRVVDQDRIRERSARTLDEVLKLEPGVYVRTGNEGVPRVDMRGQRSRQVLLLLDGIPFNSTEDGQFDPALIPTETMERVKLNFGNASALYGDGPMAGVIQIETKRPEDGVHGSLGGDFRSGEQALGRFTLTGRHEGFDLLAAGSLFDRDDFPLADSFQNSGSEDGGRRENADRERRNLLVKGGWTPSPSLRFGALVSALDGEHGVPPNAVDDETDPFASRVRYERVEEQDGLSGQVSMQWDPEGPLDVRSWLYANSYEEDRRRYDDDSYDSMDDETVNGTFQADNESLLSGHALHAAWSLGSVGKLKGAFQTRREDFDTNGRIRDVRLGRGRFDVREFESSNHQIVYNGGLEYEVEPLRDVGVVVGYGHSFLDKDSGENDDGATFLAGTFWNVRPGTRLRGSVARKVRFPSLRQLYEEGSGDEDLGAEHTWDYQIGATQELPGRTLVDVTAFWMDVDDFIETDEQTGFFANQDQYRFRGVELTVRTKPLEELDLLASYSFLDSENRSSDSEQDGLQNRPEHRATFEARYRLPYGFAVRGALYYVADQVVYSRQEPIQQRGTGDYFLTDLRVARTMLEDRFWLYFGVDNVADQDYQESYGVPGPGRVFYGGLEARY
jgi:outer membrane cobalamin receptor